MSKPIIQRNHLQILTELQTLHSLVLLLAFVESSWRFLHILPNLTNFLSLGRGLLLILSSLNLELGKLPILAYRDIEKTNESGEGGYIYLLTKAFIQFELNVVAFSRILVQKTRSVALF